MPLAFLLDENLRGRLWQAIERHNLNHELSLDVLRVGEPLDLPLGSEDPEVLHWIERESRILVSLDRKSLPMHLDAHLAAGHHVPGIFLVREFNTLQRLVEFLAAVAFASEPWEWRDRIEYI